jgi:putative membrane protein
MTATSSPPEQTGTSTPESHSPTEDRSTPPLPAPKGATWLRLALGGTLMGLANLVPGISGGTMLVAAGVYRRFIEAISDLSRFKLGGATLPTLVAVVLPALVAIALFATIVSEALIQMRWAMYSLFIGLTFGGVPVLWKVLRPATASAWIGAAVGAGGMIAITFLQSGEVTSGNMTGAWMLLFGGIAGAGAMILPGISGAYLLMLLGQYRPILEAIRSGAASVSNGDLDGVVAAGFFLAPVAIGVGIGLIAVSNLLRWLLHRFEKPTLGVLLGLLIGAPAGLYPFKEGVPPKAGDTIRGVVLDDAGATAMQSRPKDWPEQAFTPTPGHLAGSVAIIALGFALTLGVSRLGRSAQEDANTGTSTSPPHR